MTIRARRARATSSCLRASNSGINLGAWRLRDFTTWTKDANELTRADWLQRDIPALNAQVYAGETYTSARCSTPWACAGIALKTDDNMLPASLSWLCAGSARHRPQHATVTVRQNGNIIYQTSVPPGAFVLKDLYPDLFRGDLAVTIGERRQPDAVHASVCQRAKPQCVTDS